MDNKKNEELQSRREFFKKAAKTAMPIIGVVVLGSLPSIATAATDCGNSCTGGCAGSCVGACRGNCKDSCQSSCQGTCHGSCHGDCADVCRGY